MERFSNVKKRKRRDSDVAGTPMKKFKGCNITYSTEPCNKVQEDVSVRKSRAGNDGEMLGKKMRPCKVSLEDITKQWGKRKASVDAKTSEKKMGCSFNGTNSSEPSVRSAEDPWVQIQKRTASDDGDAPGEKMKCSNTSITASSPTGSSATGSSSSESSAMESNEKVTEDGKDDDIRHIFNNASLEEEKIFEMASSGNTSRAEFEDKYLQHAQIGSGGFGSVYAGLRKADSLPVAIKHVPRDTVRHEQVVCNGKLFDVILEVALMLKTAGLPGSAGQSAAISLLDWYTLKHELILVLERPDLSLDLHKYLQINRGSLPEHEAKMILRQLVDAASDMHAKGVFHRDIKLENTLIQRSSTGAPRLRVIDFGCGSFSTETSYYSFCGTPAYAPPEWFDNRTYWARPTTVWQLGALFYSLLNGREYFSTTDLIHNHIQINSALSRDCKVLLHMCLARDPVERATLEELQCCPALTQPSPPPT